MLKESAIKNNTEALAQLKKELKVLRAYQKRGFSQIDEVINAIEFDIKHLTLENQALKKNIGDVEWLSKTE
jgi:hypothetical protein